MDTPRMDSTAMKATALGLVQENVDLHRALEIGARIAQLIGDCKVGEGKVALLLAYYLSHFIDELECLTDQQKLSEVVPNLQWFAEEGTIMLTTLLQEKEIASSGDRRVKH